MPLKKGSSAKVKAANIREMVAAGHPVKQAVAAALRQADGPKKGRKLGKPRKPYNIFI